MPRARLAAPAVSQWSWSSVSEAACGRSTAQLARVSTISCKRGAAIAHGTWAFLRCYVLQRGFLDGREGFIIAAYNAHVAYYKYLKLAYDRDIATATND